MTRGGRAMFADMTKKNSLWILFVCLCLVALPQGGCQTDAHAAPPPSDSTSPPAPAPASEPAKTAEPAKAAEPTKTAEDERVALVEVASLESVSLRELLKLQGETEALRDAHLTPLIPGQITFMPLEEGQEILDASAFTPEQIEAHRKEHPDAMFTSDVVLRTDTRTYRAQQAQLRAQREQVRKDADRTRKLIEKGLGTDATLEQLATQQQVIKASVDQIQVAVDQAEVKPPIPGVVVEKFLEPLELGSPGVPVVKIVDISTIVVKVGLPERFIMLAHEGMTLPVVIEATGEVYEAVLKRIGVQANVKNRTFPLELYIPNPHRTLRAGMRATVQIDKTRLKDVVAIPRDAVLPAVSGNEVMVVETLAPPPGSPPDTKPKQVAVARRVQLGIGFRDYIVVNDGLKPSDLLIVRGHRAVVQGEGVKITSQTPCCKENLKPYLFKDEAAAPPPAAVEGAP